MIMLPLDLAPQRMAKVAQEVLMEALVEETRKPSGEIDLFRIATALSKAHVNRAKGIDHER